MSNENVRHGQTSNLTNAASEPAHITIGTESQQASDESMQTAPLSQASSNSSISAEPSRMKPTTSNDSNLYVTAESSPIQKENSDLSNTSVQEQATLNRMNQIEKILNNECSKNERSLLSPEETTDKINQQLKQIEALTKDSLNKYFDKNVLKFVDDFNNNNRFEFDPPLHSSSNDNLANLVPQAKPLETSDKTACDMTTENLLEDSMNDAKGYVVLKLNKCLFLKRFLKRYN